ncbi:uncharacterized protein LOC125515103 isoform X1 [Triticum urartu]|uniref:uncharacterized protein LOC125515103 isoform X1 n=1 Tax=Triticum urartu TaxID=4572 RepID=UPI002043D750|nr:uncharacterized protein LOC125515103 isoform X1 [Triticum urartu]
MVLIPYHRPYSRSAGGLLHLISMALELQTTFFDSMPPIHPLHQAATCRLSHLPWIAPPSSIVASTLLPRLSSSSSASSPEQHRLLYFSTNDGMESQIRGVRCLSESGVPCLSESSFFLRRLSLLHWLYVVFSLLDYYWAWGYQLSCTKPYHFFGHQCCLSTRHPCPASISRLPVHNFQGVRGDKIDGIGSNVIASCRLRCWLTLAA